VSMEGRGGLDVHSDEGARPSRLHRVLRGISSVFGITRRAPAEALIRKLEDENTRLEAANRELRREVIQRSEIARNHNAIWNALPAQVAVIDAQGTIVAINEAGARMSPGNLLATQGLGVGGNYLDACARERGLGARGAALALDGIWRVLNGDLPTYSLEYECHSTTQHSWFLMNAAPFHTGGSRGAVIMHVDTTERKTIERRHRESQDQYLLLLNSTAEGIYGLDLDGLCTFCNRAGARLLGCEDPLELVGVQLHDRHHHRDADGRPYPSASCKLCRATRQDQGVHCDAEVFFRRDGGSFPVEYWSYPMHHAGNVIGAVVTFLDVSERRKREAQFLQVQKMEAIGRLAGGVAHDFNNALQVVLTCAELLEARLDRADPDRSLIGDIKSAGLRGAALTRHLFSFGRKQPLPSSVIDLGAVIADLEPMLQRMLGEDLCLRTRCAARAPAILADHAQIEQVLMNFVLNAREAMPLGGELLIETTDVEIDEPATSDRVLGRTTSAGTAHGGSALVAGAYVRLRVCGTGHGLDAASSARVFGAGIGLSTGYGIVRPSHASIEVETAAGRGTSFQLYFPAGPTVSASQVSEARAP